MFKLGIISTQYDRHAYSFAFSIETQQSLKWEFCDIVHWTAGRTIWKLYGLCCLTIQYSQNADVIFQNGLDISHLELKALKPGNWKNKKKKELVGEQNHKCLGYYLIFFYCHINYSYKDGIQINQGFK